MAIHTADVLTHEGYSHQTHWVTHWPEVVYIDRGYFKTNLIRNAPLPLRDTTNTIKEGTH